MYKFIITSGPTREFIDPIRFISNSSTGRMGHSIAKAAIEMGYPISYICGPVNKEFQSVEKAKNISVISTIEMQDAVLGELSPHSVLIMAAAPADYRSEVYHDKKIKKELASSINLILNPDILKAVSTFKNENSTYRVISIGFAAETHNVEFFAKQKLKEKKLDMIYLNNLTKAHSGFGSLTNELILFSKDGTQKKWNMDTKEKLGYKIIQEISKLLLEET